MSTIEIPVRADIPSYEFKQDLEGVVYTLKFRWNERMLKWIMSICNEQGEDLLTGIPVYTNVDLKSRFRDSALPPGLFLSYDESGLGRDPDRLNFGTDVKLMYLESV